MLAAALVVSGCSLFVTDNPTTTEPSTTTTTLAPTTTVLAGLPVELTDCSNPPEGFDVLCDTYRLLEEHYVDPLDDAALAAGAARGIEEFEPETTGTEPPTQIACALPTAAFEDACEVFAEVQSGSPAPAVDLVEAAVRGMIQYGLEDPHTVYLSPTALAPGHRGPVRRGVGYRSARARRRPDLRRRSQLFDPVGHVHPDDRRHAGRQPGQSGRRPGRGRHRHGGR